MHAQKPENIRLFAFCWQVYTYMHMERFHPRNIFASIGVIKGTVKTHTLELNASVADLGLQALGDAELLKASVGRPALFEEIVRRYERLFMRKAIAILRDRDAAYDAVQETFVRIYIASHKFKKQEGASFSSWAYKILVNQCYTAHTKRERHQTVSFEAEPEFAEIIPDKAGLDAMEKRLTSDYVMSLVSKLPIFLRRVVRLYFIEGVAQKEIARREGVSNEVVRQRIYRAKKELKKMNLEFAPAESGEGVSKS
ncbi:MAG: FecI sigma-24 factor [Candidatus Parcubacteria bacterium]|nr:FecI sigma-24 factor [Candidatus Parcubacteria bacterium]